MATTSGTVNCLSQARPPVTRFGPSLWNETFSNFSFDEKVQKKYEKTIEELKQEARGMLMAAASPIKQMIFIDTLERLGLAYHFETEIEQKLREIYDYVVNLDDYDLFATSLRFRLLRQHGHHISCDVFDEFADKEGKFKETLRNDTEGLLSLYEASHVRFRDENILEEGERFTRHELRCVESELKSPLKEKVKRALEHPFHRDVPIFHTRFFISIYENDPSMDELLLKLAKFNFNFMQNLYKKELYELFRWWNKFDLKAKLSYARDRLVEAYIWGLGIHYEPQYFYVRKGVTKGLQIATIVDDTYDNYATLDEAQLLTNILNRAGLLVGFGRDDSEIHCSVDAFKNKDLEIIRENPINPFLGGWNKDKADKLPDYLKIVYEFIMSTFEDFERDAAKQGKEFAIPYFKETIQQLGRGYNRELKWVMKREMPSFEEYAKNSETASCIYIIFAAIIPGLKSLTKEAIDWIKSEPKLALSAAMVGRFWNDIGTHERENKGGQMLTAVDCYMKQYGVSKQETKSKFGEFVEDKWKDINKEWATTSPLHNETKLQFLNYARMADACYNKNNGDAFTDPEIFSAQIASVFVDPIVI